MNAFVPGAVMTIKGQRCVVLRDVIAHSLPPSDDLVVIDHFDDRMIYCSLSELKNTRQRYPLLPAYGFWQILFCSQLVNTKDSLQAVYFDEDAGQYLYQSEAKIAFTGEIRHGIPIASAGYVIDADNIRVVVCEVPNLCLPRKAVLSFEEREREKSKRNFDLALRFVAGAIFFGVALFIYDNKLQSYGTEQQAIRDALAGRAEMLSKRKDFLHKTRVRDVPDQQRMLDDLLHLAIGLEKFTLPETSFEHSDFEVRAPNHDIHSSPILSMIVDNVEYHQDGLLSLHWERSK